MTKLGTGLAKGEDLIQVVEQAFQEAKSNLGERRVDLVLVYCAAKYDYQKVVDTVRRLTGGAPLIGCSTGGEFTEKKVEKGSIAVGLVYSDDMKFFTCLEEGLKEDDVGVMRRLAEKKPEVSPEYPFLGGILYIDGLAGKGEEVPVNLFNMLGTEVIFGGGAAADDLKFEKTFVFCDDEVASNAASLCYILSKKPLFTSVRHGHIPLSTPLKVTKAKGSVVYEVDGRNAWEVWKEYTREDAKKIGIDVDKLSTPTEIGSFLIRYELGIPVGNEYKVRVPLSKNEDGSLNFACTIPEGADIFIMKSPKEDQVFSARKAMEIAKERAGGARIAGALIFDCVCRAIILEEDFASAVEEFKRILGEGVPILGWETYGEICFRTGEFSGFHNTTSVVMLLPE
ncbi:MAG: hypothetical protein B6D56_01980 [Candidatus Omnitrophica bacterium 4484_70.1]|nr:MAG: hypothetical protein B6D56_01980 [Candidatus Omnitrophica bacterium 4484_70.1]